MSIESGPWIAHGLAAAALSVLLAERNCATAIGTSDAGGARRLRRLCYATATDVCETPLGCDSFKRILVVFYLAVKTLDILGYIWERSLKHSYQGIDFAV